MLPIWNKIGIDYNEIGTYSPWCPDWGRGWSLNSQVGRGSIRRCQGTEKMNRLNMKCKALHWILSKRCLLNLFTSQIYLIFSSRMQDYPTKSRTLCRSAIGQSYFLVSTDVWPAVISIGLFKTSFFLYNIFFIRPFFNL